MDVVHAGFPGQTTDDLPDGDPFKWSTRVAQEKSSIIAAIIEPREFGVEMLDILSDGFASGHTNRYQSFTVSLAVYKHDSERLLVFVETNGTDLGCSQAGGVHEFEHGSVPHPESS